MNQYIPVGLRSQSFLHWFQSQRPGRAPQGLCRDQEALICPISKRFLGHFFVNPPPPSRLVSPGCRLSGWQRQTLHLPPQHASKQAPREMARHSGKASEEFGNVVFKIGSAGRPNRKSCRPSCASHKAVIQSTANRPTGSLGASSGSPRRLVPENGASSEGWHEQWVQVPPG